MNTYNDFLLSVMNDTENLYTEYASVLSAKAALNISNESARFYAIANEAVSEKIKNFGKSILDFLKKIWEKIRNFFLGIFKKVREFFSKAKSKTGKDSKAKSDPNGAYYIVIDANGMIYKYNTIIDDIVKNLSLGINFLKSYDKEKLQALLDGEKSKEEQVLSDKMKNASEAITAAASVSNNAEKRDSSMKQAEGAVNTLEDKCKKIMDEFNKSLSALNASEFNDADCLNIFKEYMQHSATITVKVVTKVITEIRKIVSIESNSYKTEKDAKAAIESIKNNF